jgi:3'(2'), 5'-bisphosphate nucleotidase
MKFQNSPEVEFTLGIVRQASELVSHIQKAMVSDALTKGDRSPVTVADYAAQALVGRALMDAFPADPLIGEEDSQALRTDDHRDTLAAITDFVGDVVGGANAAEVCRWIDHGSADSGQRYWTVDPIDGTKGFLRGMQYAVALALVEDGQLQVGALGCPNLSIDYLLSPTADLPMQESGRAGSLVIAVRGQGTWAVSLEGGEYTRLSVSGRDEGAQARLLRSYESAHTNTGQIGELVAALNVQAEPVAMDSQAKYAVLAAGHGDMLVRLLSAKRPDYREKIWDQAAGALVVQEAGGRITDLHGQDLDFAQGRTLANNRGVLASNGHLHPVALDALHTIKA